jgi:hypothetical protein
LITKHQLIIEKMARPGQFKGKAKDQKSHSPKKSTSPMNFSDYGSDFENLNEEEK